MKRQFILSLCSLVWLLCLGTFARGQTVSISGQSPVCKGSSHIYSVTPASGLIYHWYVNAKGNISGTTAGTATILWGLDGAGQVDVYAIDSHGDTVDNGTLGVTVLPTPVPSVATDFKVACKNLIPPVITDEVPDPPTTFDDTGCVKVCSYMLIKYTATGGVGSTYTWTVNGGTINSYPTPESVSILWGGPGQGSITVTETTVDGCVGTRTLCLDIIESPIAYLTAMPDSSQKSIAVCDSTEVVFIDYSISSATSPIVSWKWSFGDGTYSNLQSGPTMPVTHMYTAPGIYTVTLTVANQCGCSTTDTMYVYVSATTGVKISCPGVVCENATQTYGVDQPCAPGSWSVLGGSFVGAPTASSVTIKWTGTADGFGYLMYTPTAACASSCPNTTVVKIPVVMSTGTIKGATVLCPNTQYIYRLPQWPSTTFTWNLSNPAVGTLSKSDQPNEIILTTGSSGAIGNITCSYTNTLLGCTGNATLAVNVRNPEVIVGDKKACLNTQGNTYSLLNGGVGTWTLRDPDNLLAELVGSSSTFNYTASTFNKTGVWVLRVMGPGFCPPEPMYIRVDPLPAPPDSIYGPDRICRGVPIQYTAGQTQYGSTFGWAVDNGSVNLTVGDKTYVTLNPSSTGPFVIRLWREDKAFPYCHSDTITRNIDTPLVVLNVTGDTTPCKNNYFNYEASYKEAEYYKWSIIDPLMGSVSTGQGTDVSNVLWNNQAGFAQVICEIQKCSSKFYDTLDVDVSPPFPAPMPYLSYTNATYCWGAPINIQVSDFAGPYAIWNFNQKDDPFIDTTVINYVFDDPLTGLAAVNMPFSVFLPNPSGCPDGITLNGNVDINPPPRTYINSSAGVSFCTKPFSTNLSVVNYGTNPPVATYQWYDGSGNMIGTPTTPFTATDYGKYYVVATSLDGCSDFSDTIEIKNCGDPCNIDTTLVDFVATVTGSLDSCRYVHLIAGHGTLGFTGYSWTVKSDQHTEYFSGTDGAADYIFNEAGLYEFTYSATYFDGTNTCTKTATIVVDVPYVPKFEITPFCTEDAFGKRAVVLGFTGSQTATISSLEWLIPGGTWSPTYNVNLTPGANIIGVRISGPASTHVCTYFNTWNVPALPNADYTFARPITCIKEAAVEFTNTTTNGFTLLWRFGDQSENTQSDPEKVYDDATDDTKDVTLIVQDIYSCKDSITKTVEVIADQMDGSLSASPTVVCEGSPITLTYDPSPGALGSIYYWMKDGDTIAVTPTQTTNVFSSGYYFVHAADQYGCYSETAPVNASVIQMPEAVVFGDNDHCVDEEFELSGYAGSDPFIIYQWYGPGGLLAGETNPTLTQTINTAGTYNYTVEITYGACTRMSDVFTVTIHGTPTTPTVTYNVLDCTDYTIELTANPMLPGTYNWSSGASGNPVQVYEGGPHQVTYTDQYGCESKGYKVTPKDPKVYLWIFPSGCYSLCSTASYTVTGPIIPFTQWAYYKNGSVDISGMNYVPDYIINTTGSYNLELNNGYCTAMSGDMKVTMYGCGEGERRTNNTFNNDGAAMELAKDGSSILLAPNPAQNSTTLQYRFANATANHTVEIMDAVGRRIHTATLNGKDGALELSLFNYTPGLYQVVIREAGNILMQSRLSIYK